MLAILLLIVSMSFSFFGQTEMNETVTVRTMAQNKASSEHLAT